MPATATRELTDEISQLNRTRGDLAQALTALLSAAEATGPDAHVRKGAAKFEARCALKRAGFEPPAFGGSHG